LAGLSARRNGIYAVDDTAEHLVMLLQDVLLKMFDESFMPEIPCQRNRQRPKFVKSIIV
jgi:hypothetical protein